MIGKEQQTEFLGWNIIPVRLDATRTAWFLGFDPHEVPVLAGPSNDVPLEDDAKIELKFVKSAERRFAATLITHVAAVTVTFTKENA